MSETIKTTAETNDDGHDGMVQCYCCGGWIDKEDAIYVDEQPLCDDCYNSDCTYYCDHCEETHLAGDDVASTVYVYNDYGRGRAEVWCPDCVEEDAHRCDDCGDLYSGTGDSDGETDIYRHGYRHVCGECLEDNYYCCTDCGVMVHADDVIWSGRWNDDPYCPGCAPTKELKSYGHTHVFTTLAVNGEDSPALKLGMELETEADDNVETAEAVRDVAERYGDRDYLDCKKDGSLEGEGCEIVTQPMTVRFALTSGFIPDMVKAALDNGAASHDTDGRCGLHVHVSRSQLRSARSVYNFCSLIYGCSDEWERFSRRDDYTYCRLSGFEYGGDTPDERYRNWQLGTASGSAGARYSAVNLRNSETVELRLMRGTLNLETLSGTLQAVAALAYIAREYDMRGMLIDGWGWERVKAEIVTSLNRHGLPCGEFAAYCDRRGL